MEKLRSVFSPHKLTPAEKRRLVWRTDILQKFVENKYGFAGGLYIEDEAYFSLGLSIWGMKISGFFHMKITLGKRSSAN